MLPIHHDKLLAHHQWSTCMFQIREAQAAEALAIAALHVQTYNETHCGGEDRGPPLELRSRQWSDLFASNDGSWFCYVAVDNLGNFIGFARGTPHDGGVPGYQGELNKIYVQRVHHRQGIGKQLLLAVARQFIERGVNSMLLFGDAGNPSNGFYQHFGAERLLSPTGEFHGGYGWRDLQKLVGSCGG
jgi:GNAT superfamily N-acetyltransferase